MIASALSEITSSAAASLPAQLAVVAAKYGVTLVAPGAVEPWLSYETDQVRTALGANGTALVSVRWAADAETQLGRPSAGVRDTTMRVIVSYIYKDSSLSAVQTHIQYVPEAIALWLDAFPIGSRVPGATITKIAPPLGRKIVMRQRKEDVREANGTTTFIWHAEAEFDIEIRDPLPSAAPVVLVTLSPTSATLPIGGTQQLTAVATDASGNVLVGRNLFYAVSDGIAATVSAAGVVTKFSSSPLTVAAIVEGRMGLCAIAAAPSITVYGVSTPVIAWWKRDTLTSAANGDALSGWADASASGLDLVVNDQSAAPTWDATTLGGSVAFSGTQAFHNLGFRALVNVTGYTIFVVGKSALVDLSAFLGTQNYGVVVGYQYVGTLRQYIAGNIDQSYFAFSDTGSHVFEDVYDGTQSSNATRMVRLLDGTIKALTFPQGAIPATESVENSGIGVGVVQGDPNSYFHGNIAEVLIVAGPMSVGNRTTIRQALGTKYGIAVT